MSGAAVGGGFILLRRIVAAIILIPLAVLIIAFAVANRHPVTVSFDPFGGNPPVASLTLPLFALVIVVLIGGVVIGGFASWLGQGKWRGAARRFERDLAELRRKHAAREGSGDKPAAGAETPAERLRLRPPAR
jgi:uncharacterized integral membrane protein